MTRLRALRQLLSSTGKARRGAAAWARAKGGNVTVIAAVSILPLTMLAGGAADLARAWRVRVELQDAIDAAVLAGVKSTTPTATAAAAFQVELDSSAQVSAPVFALSSNGRLSGSVTARSSNAFLGIANVGHFDVSGAAVAALRPRPNDVCLTTLDTASASVVKAGSSALQGNLCKFDVRTTASPAASFMGSGSVSSQQLCVRGSTVAQNGSAVSGLELNCTLAAPYRAETVAPPVGACAATNPAPVTGGTVYPGVYCGNVVLEGSSPITLVAGDYIFKGAAPGVPGSLWVRGSAAVIGEGVSIYLADNSTVRLEGTGELRLTAPTTGVRQGVLFHEAPGLPQSTMTITRSGAGMLRGVMNLPSRNVFVASSGTTTTDELTMVVNRLTMEGSGTWRFTSAPPSVADRLRGFPYLTE